MIEIHVAIPIIHGISPFQVHRILLDTLLQYFPALWVLPTCSGISSYRNGAPRCRKLASVFLHEDLAQSGQKIALSSSSYALRDLRISTRLHYFFMERGGHQVAHYSGSGRYQKCMLQCQLFTESQNSKCV